MHRHIMTGLENMQTVPLNILQDIPLQDLTFFFGFYSGLFSLPVFLIYILHFNSKKITHQRFIKQSIYFINFFIICYSIFFFEKPTDPLPYILFISFFVSFNLIIFKFIPGEDISD